MANKKFSKKGLAIALGAASLGGAANLNSATVSAVEDDSDSAKITARYNAIPTLTPEQLVSKYEQSVDDIFNMLDRYPDNNFPKLNDSYWTDLVAKMNWPLEYAAAWAPRVISSPEYIIRGLSTEKKQKLISLVSRIGKYVLANGSNIPTLNLVKKADFGNAVTCIYRGYFLIKNLLSPDLQKWVYSDTIEVMETQTKKGYSEQYGGPKFDAWPDKFKTVFNFLEQNSTDLEKLKTMKAQDVEDAKKNTPETK